MTVFFVVGDENFTSIHLLSGDGSGGEAGIDENVGTMGEGVSVTVGVAMWVWLCGWVYGRRVIVGVHSMV